MRALLVCALALVACDGGEVVGTYPSGPYGQRIGEVLPNFVGDGYLSAGAPLGPVSFADLRAEGTRYLLIQAASLLCAPCVADARLVNERLPGWQARGGAAAGVLVMGDLDQFLAKSEATNPWLRNPSTPAKLDDYFEDLLLPTFFLVDVPTMKLVDRFEGDPEAAFARFDALLD